MKDEIRVIQMSSSIIKSMKDLFYDEKGEFKLLSYNDLKNIPYDHLRLFMHMEAIYSIPTIESVEFLDNIIGDETAIGIGSGRAWWEKELGMIATDSMVQKYDKNVIELYKRADQPLITYPDFVERIDGVQAAIKYKPHTVFGSYITPKKDLFNVKGSAYGIVEEDLMKYCKRYIKIGSIGVHGDYSLCRRPHDRIIIPELITRSHRGDSCIFIWEN